MQLLTAADFKQFLPPGKSISTTLIDRLLKDSMLEITDHLGYDMSHGEESIITWKTMYTNLADIELPFRPKQIIDVRESVRDVYVGPDQYKVRGLLMTRIPSGFYYPNTFDTVAYGLSQYWLSPLTITLIPEESYVSRVREVLVDLILLRLAKLGRIGSAQFDNLIRSKTSQQERQWGPTSVATYDENRKTILKRLNRGSRIG
jgi:hypothetical protein